MNSNSLRTLPYALAGAGFALATRALADVPPGPPPDPAPQPPPEPMNGAAPTPQPPPVGEYGPTNAADGGPYPVDPPEAAGFDWMLWGGIALVAAVAVLAIVFIRRRKP